MSSLLPRLSGLLCLAALLCGGGLAQGQELPGACAADGGLDYYRCRAEDFVRREPRRELPSYYLEYGDRYMRRFSNETRPLLSPAGQRWIDRVRRGLQEAIEVRRREDPFGFARLEGNSELFTDFTYGTHAEAYLAAGFADLPLRDLVIIGSTPDTQDILSERGRRQLTEVLHRLVGSCRSVASCLVERVLIEARESRRLFRERLRLRPTGSVFRWLVRRTIGSALRALRSSDSAAPKPGIRGRLLGSGLR